MLQRLLVPLLFAGATACAPAPDGASGTGPGHPVPGPGDHAFTLEHGGRERTYLVHAPPQVSNGQPLPVVLAFHGGGGNARGFQSYAGLDAVADREGFLAVYPEGTGRLGLHTWNAGPRCCGYALEHDVDDVGFTRAVIADLARRTGVDPSRIYATGHSNGAGMSYRLALEAPDLVAAVAPVAGAAMGPTEGSTEAVPILHIHSVDDPRALYGGGEGPPFPLTNRTVMHQPVEEVLAFWAGVDGCPDEPRVAETLRAPADGPDAGQWAEKLVWEGCTRAPLIHWRLHGAGHGWPGHRLDRRRERLVGPSTELLDAAEEVWAFFRGLPATSPAGP